MSQAVELIATTLPNNTTHQEIVAKQKATWEDGDYASFATYMEAGAAEILDGWPIAPGEKMLDIGCGSGQTALPAAKKGIQVTGIDIATNLINHATARARKLDLAVRFDEGNAEQLPYDDHSFDSAISLIGAMFAPDPDRVTGEMARVLKPGGRLYMANWTSSSMPAQMFKHLSRIVPPPAGIPAPVLWGDEGTVLKRLEKHFTDIRLTRKYYPQWHYPFAASDVVELFRNCFGPVKRAFAATSPDQHDALHKELESIYANNGEYINGVFTVTNGQYLEVIATRK